MMGIIIGIAMGGFCIYLGFWLGILYITGKEHTQTEKWNNYINGNWNTDLEDEWRDLRKHELR